MLEAIIAWSLRHRLLVIAGAGALAIAGLLSLGRLEFDAFPDTTPVQVQINVAAPALSPEEIERQITAPVEAAIGGLPGLEGVRSISKFGLSQVVATFEDGTEILVARQLVAERLAAVELPEGMPRPQMGPVTTGLGEVFHYLVTSDRGDPTDLRTAQDWILKPPLRAVPGVAEVNGWGGHEKRYEVRIDPAKLLARGLAFEDAVEAVAAGNLNVGGGSLSTAGGMLLVRGIGRTSSCEEIGGIVVAAREGVPVRVRDVAEVAIGHEVRRGAVTADGKGEAVLGLGFMLAGGNSGEVAARLRERLGEAREGLPAEMRAEVAYDRTELVDRVIGTVRKNLFEGGLLVIAVLFAFLGSFRAGLIVALAIPLSMLFAFSGMLRFGIAGSLLSLGALDFGLVVDSSVILVENVLRRLGQGDAAMRPRLDLVRDAAVEVRRPTMFGELIILVVYLPVLTLEGVEGKMFRPMALTVILALLGSLVLSLTLLPVLASLVLPRRAAPIEPVIVRAARRLYAPVLRFALRQRAAAVGLGLCALLGAAILARGLGSEFVPRLWEGAVVINIVRLAGTDLDESIRYNTLMERAILAAFPDEVERVWSRIGTAEVATDPMGVELSDIFIALRPRERWTKARSQEELVAGIDRELRDLPGQRIAFTQPIEMRMNELVSGLRSDVAAKIFGDDLGVLEAKAREVEAVLRSIPGCADPSVEQVEGQPILEVRVDPAASARYGVPARKILDLVEAIGGKPVGDVVEGQLRFPLAATLPDRRGRSPDDLGALPLLAPGGEVVPLGRLASLKVVEGATTINREWGRRRSVVQCNVRGRDVGGFVEEARRAVAARVKLPPGRYSIEWGGQFENLERGRARLALVIPAALALVLVLLAASLGSTRLALLVFTGVPFAATGGVAALWLRGMPFSISAGVGFVALSGVAVLNGLVLVTFIRDLRLRGIPMEDAVLAGCLARLRPVLMTALVAALGFVPMAAAVGVGAEVQKPLATVVIGGVITSTILTLVLLPALYGLFEGTVPRIRSEGANPRDCPRD
jgi:cobalt-zinc-cadmium resistance protein CzcA